MEVNFHLHMYRVSNLSFKMSAIMLFFYVPQDIKIGGNVTRIVVQGPQDKSKWHFAFLTTGRDHEWFRIDDTTGIITVRRPLDREQQTVYEVCASRAFRSNCLIK